ncbi:MAG: thymidine phosphorylase [Acidiferrobacteraceae bacterium]|nr:thymidine phosphorylase [Acidiferrobacteraceae bacterium]
MGNEFLPQEVIRKKRNGEELTKEEVTRFIAGLATDAIGEGQVAAFAMAVFFNGMSSKECAAMTLAMRDSGEVMRWYRSRLHGPVVDKHSTGGVGDAVSLMLAPMLAACGAHVPMISGRGLGHTGGTLDKLASIPGYDLRPSSEKFQSVVEEVGCAIIGQTSALAPADSRLYAVRDVTATVESVSLITASILSKKLASGLDALVMDIKVGNGAFMNSMNEARELATSINRVADEAGLKTSALVTDMNQPLAPVAGNALEISECVDYLQGRRRDARLHEVVIGLGSALLMASGLAQEQEQAKASLEASLASGEALTRFDQMVAALGGPLDFSQSTNSHLPAASIVRDVCSLRAGFVSSIDTRSIGLAVVQLGGGRTHPDDEIDLSVGLDRIVRLGDSLEVGEPICRVHAANEAATENVKDIIAKAVVIDEKPADISPVVIERIA